VLLSLALAVLAPQSRAFGGFQSDKETRYTSNIAKRFKSNDANTRHGLKHVAYNMPGMGNRHNDMHHEVMCGT
jgi:hypothetical protein